MREKTVNFLDIARPYLDPVEEIMRTPIPQHHPYLSDALDEIVSSGGKRVRPTIVILIGLMLQADMDRITTLAAAIEMLHTATLVHDDLIDRSDVRRGNPTLNSRWSSGATVLTGDYLFARAANLAANTGSLQVIDLFSSTLMTIVNGEITQMFGKESADLFQSYLDRIYAKTASLFEVAAEGTAIISETSEEIIGNMRLFGYNLGLAFQIVDDILDICGDEERIGKPIASDLRQGLITLPTLYFLEESVEENSLRNRIQNQQLSGSEIDLMAEKICASEAIPRSIQKSESYIEAAKSYLESIPPSEARDALLDVADYVIARTK
jgi:geranylgeranyl pyrophosphate synthase